MTTTAGAEAPAGAGSVRWLDAEEQRAWRAYLSATALLQDRLNRDLEATSGLTMPEYDILVRLSEVPERARRMSELATEVVHSRSRLTHTVSRMEARGLVRREPCPDDGRGVLCSLTDEGYRSLVDAAPAHVASVRAALLDPLSREQFLALGEAMSAVRDHVTPR